MRKMVSLALSREEKDKSYGPMIGMADDSDETKYPCGCCLYLDDATIAKLDLDNSDVEKGDSLHFYAVGKVVRLSDGPEGKCIHLQLTDIGIDGEDAEEPEPKSDEGRAKGRYGSDDEDDAA